eukprot:55123-Prorocentrum_minimum.AAC.3
MSSRLQFMSSRLQFYVSERVAPPLFPPSVGLAFGLALRRTSTTLLRRTRMTLAAASMQPYSSGTDSWRGGLEEPPEEPPEGPPEAP